MKSKLLIFMLFSFVSFNSASFAQQFRYDLPANDYLFKEKFVDKSFVLIPRDYRVILVSARLVKWSEYLGPKDNTKKIAPNRMVWEVLRTYCRLASNGEIRYYFDAVDAVTKERLVKKRTQQTNNISLVSPWAAKDVKCSFPGRE
jgi:hypothetical protein